MKKIAIKAIPYFKNPPTLPREVVLTQYFDRISGKWETYKPENATEALVLNFDNLEAGDYLASAPHAPADVTLPLMEAIYQHFSFPGMTRLSDAIEDDFLNQLSTLQSYFIFLDHHRRVGGASTVSSICTLIEFALINHRSGYDILNDVVIRVLAHTDAKKSTIPDSFRRVAQKSADDLKSKHGFTDQLVAFYKDAEQRFMTLRAVRDRITHEGRSPGLVICYDDGFGLFLRHGLFHGMDVALAWPPSQQRSGEIGSGLSLLAFLARDLRDAMDAAASALKQSFAVLPPAVAPDHCFFTRNRLLQYYSSLDRYMSGPWLNPGPELN